MDLVELRKLHQLILGDHAPYCTDMAIKAGAGDTWHARRLDGSTSRYKTTVLASNIARVLFKQLS